MKQLGKERTVLISVILAILSIVMIAIVIITDIKVSAATDETPCEHEIEEGACTKCEHECTYPTGDDATGICNECGITCNHERSGLQAWNDNHHWKPCSICEYKINMIEHTFSVPIKIQGNDDKHIVYCTTTSCNYRKEESHDSEESLQWSKSNEGHWKVCRCGHAITEVIPHTTEENNAFCNVCNYDTDHVHEFVNGPTVIAPTCTENGYSIYFCTCGESYKDEYVEKLGHDMTEVTCENPPTCKREGCVYTEGQGGIGHDFDKEATCTESATCQREGCGFVQEPLGHLLSEATCTETAMCQREGCTYTEGTALGHDMREATCTEAAICQREDCGYTEGTALGHDMREATCTEAAICQREDCGYTEGTALGHDMSEATCTEASKCKRIGCMVTSGEPLGHDFSEWEDNNNGTHIRKCTKCTGTETAECNYGTDNICTVCGGILDNGCEHDYQIDKAGATETQHWEKCTKCGYKRNIANHAYNNGKCAVCEYSCQHRSKTLTYNETHHWERCNTCGKKINETEHSFVNEKCECGATKTEEVCTHEETVTSNNSTTHWKKCKNCGEEIQGTRKTHTYTNGICECGARKTEEVCTHEEKVIKRDNAQHWKVCTVCGTEIDGTRKNHTYVNGKCECGAIKNEEQCTHDTKKWVTDGNEHYQQCNKCGTTIEGTRAKHVYVDGKCKNCGVTDNTSTGTKLPDTGKGKTIVIISIVTVMSAIGVVGLKKYKEI